MFIPRIGSKAYQAIMSFGSTEFQLPLSTGLQMGSESVRGAVLGSSCLRHERLFTATIFSARLSLTRGAFIVTDVTSAVVLYQRATVRRGDRILDCGSHIGSWSLLALQSGLAALSLVSWKHITQRRGHAFGCPVAVQGIEMTSSGVFRFYLQFGFASRSVHAAISRRWSCTSICVLTRTLARINKPLPPRKCGGRMIHQRALPCFG